MTINSLRAVLLWLPLSAALLALDADGPSRAARAADDGRLRGEAAGELAGLSAVPDWVHDALVVANPAAAVGGCQAGIYTPAVNGVKPWRQAIIRWLTGRQVMGNTAVLVRQEGAEGGAGLSAIVDPHADYVFEVSTFIPQGGDFGDPQDKQLQLRVTVLDAGDHVIAESPAASAGGGWAPSRVSFSSGPAREVRCLVRARSPRQVPCFYYAEGFRLTRKDQDWWTPQNLFDAARTAVRLRDERELLLQTLDPDVVGGHNGVYLNWDGFFTRRGIAVGGGHWEQEYNHVAIDDPVASQFADNGWVRQLDGQVVAKAALWPGYHMCHNAPLWHAYQRQRMVRVASEVQLISQDNICAPSFEQAGRGCFCRWCRDGFRDWLHKRWTGDQFRAAGVVDSAAFDIVGYVKQVEETRIARGRDAVLGDPVLRAFIQFQYASQLDCWRDNVMAARQAAGTSIAVCGNQWGAGGRRPYSVAVSQINDVIVVETGSGPKTPQQRAWDALSSKLALAAGDYQRPVWLFMTSLFHSPEAAHSRLRMAATQALADGGAPSPWATAAGPSGWFYDAEAQLSRFIQKHRALFARRDRCANVGLVYSLPTHAWRSFRAFQLSSAPYAQWFVAWAQLLEEAHVPYEANCWRHPLLGDDRISLERLKRYQVLVLPGVDCFSDAQREAVRAFQARGGRVIAVATQSYYDADGVPRPAGETLAAEGERLLQVDPDLLTQYARGSGKPSRETAGETAAAAEPLQAVLRRAMADDSILETDAPADVWANVWLDDTRQVLALHLVNSRIDVPADRFRPVKGSRWRVRLPAGLEVTQALAISPDEPGEGKPLAVQAAQGWATVEVPLLESYTVVALFRGEALAAASRLAEARRAHWRASLIGGEADAGFQARLMKTLAMLRAGQLDAGALSAAELARGEQARLRGSPTGAISRQGAIE